MTTIPSTLPSHIYKLVTIEEWERAIEQGGSYQGSALDLKDGFMHLSSKEEVELSAKLYYSQLHEVLLLKVNNEKIAADTKWEFSQARNAHFPHLYNKPLLKEDVDEIFVLKKDNNNLFVFPTHY